MLAFDLHDSLLIAYFHGSILLHFHQRLVAPLSVEYKAVTQGLVDELSSKT